MGDFAIVGGSEASKSYIGSTDQTLAYSPDIIEGNLLIATVFAGEHGSLPTGITDTSSNDWQVGAQYTDDSLVGSVSIFYAIANADASDLTLTFALDSQSDYWEFDIETWTVTGGTPTLDPGSTTTYGDSSTLQAPQVDPANPNGLFYSAGSYDGVDTPSSVNSPFTGLLNVESYLTAYYEASDDDTYGGAWDITSNHWIGATVAFNIDTSTAPSAPSLNGQPLNAENLLTWTTPDDGGSAITGYTLVRGGSTIFTGLANSYADYDVVAGETYQYYVYATNVIGNSPNSNTVTLTAIDIHYATRGIPVALFGVANMCYGSGKSAVYRAPYSTCPACLTPVGVAPGKPTPSHPPVQTYRHGPGVR